MEESKICSFFGHREIHLTDDLRLRVENEILGVIDLGCRTFYFGGYGEFDRLCYNTALQIRLNRPDLNLRMVYCVPRECYLRKRVRYFRPEDYDEVIYLAPAFDWWYKSIYYRNCAMIDRSDAVIFYSESREESGAYKAYKYAVKKNGKHIINLW